MLQRLAALLAILLAPTWALAQGTAREDFEGPEPVLRPAGGDARHRVELHQRVQEGPHSGRWCEQVRIAGNDGTTVYYSYPLKPAHVIADLAAGIWVRSDRPGLQIAARVVLPRTKHPQNGAPLTTLLHGSDYQQVGNWQLLKIGRLPQALTSQVRMLRSQFPGTEVDAREAYVDLLLVNVYGGPGTTNVWFDNLEISGIVSVGSANMAAAPPERGEVPTMGARALPPARAVPNVEFKAGRLSVAGKPFFPRIVDHQGEPLARLKALGCNCVRVQTLSPSIAAEAASLGIWLIAPPPAYADLQARRNTGGAGDIDAVYDCVLAWDFGGYLTHNDLERTRAWAELVQGADRRDRPLVCHAQTNLEGFTRPPFKILWLSRDVFGTTLSIDRFPKWVEERGQLARAGAPVWTTIPIEPPARLVEQVQLLGGPQTAPPVWQEAQIRSLVHAALAARSRAICFGSRSRLDAEDPATRARAAVLELTNLELELIERWPAAGNFAMLARSSNPHTTGAVIETDHSRLLLPIYSPPGGQFVIGKQPAPLVSFLVQGVPEGDDAYELSLAGFRRLRSARVAGGTQVVFDELSRDSLVVFTQDPAIVKNLKDGLDKLHRRAAQLARELAALELARLDPAEVKLAAVGRSIPATRQARAKAAEALQLSDAAAASDLPRAYYQSRHALQTVRQIERLHWEQATSALGNPLMSPLALSFDTLPEQHRLAHEILQAPRGQSRLREGSCENLNAMLQAGWKHFQHRHDGLKSAVELSPQAAHGDHAGLLLKVTVADPKLKPIAAVETPPLWVTSAPIDVRAGELVEIQAWVKIDTPLSAGVDGLLIIDSLAGEPLAVSLSSTKDWQQVTMLRAAPRNGRATVTFAMSAVGEVAIDDVSMRVIARGPAVHQQAQQLPPVIAPRAGSR